MSEPQRYHFDSESGQLFDASLGEWVRYADYAALQAENERLSKLFANTERLMLLDGEFEAAKVGTYAALQAEVERLGKVVGKLCFEKDQLCELRQNAEAARLQAENERLRKAGDAVIEKLAEAYAGEPSDFDHAHVFKGWIEAKGEQPNK